MPNFFGMLEREICRMVTAKAAARRHYLIYARFVHRPRRQLLHQHVIIPGIITCAVGRMYVLIVPGKPVQRIKAVYLNETFINKPPHTVDQAKILVLVIAALRRREKDYRITLVAKNQHFKVGV